MIRRQAETKILELAKQFKAVAITGPRQSGKTTLVRHLFADKPYVSLENPDTRRFAQDDPRGFLAQYNAGAIFDEVQRTPELFSYMQEPLDNSTQPGLFILTGSNNFLLQQNIAQSLAGRVAYFHLLPFTMVERYGTATFQENEVMFQGLYPPVYDQHIAPENWYPNYIATYVERDVRQIKNISDLSAFERVLRLLAARTGQELNVASVSVEAGVDSKTIQSWISILESSFIVYLLKPHYQNFNKTITKRPKLYFYDTGLVCSLLGITSETQLAHHPLRGSLFECLVITEMLKKRTNLGTNINLYYWRDKTGHEIDLIIDNGGQLVPVEIKSAHTIIPDFFKNLFYWNKLSGMDIGYLIYAGTDSQKRSNGIEVVGLQEMVGRDM